MHSVCSEIPMGSSSYTASRDAGPLNPIVTTSSARIAVSLAAYQESPLLNSLTGHHLAPSDTGMIRNGNRCSDLGSAGELTEFVEVIGVLPAEETGGEEEGPREEDVGQPTKFPEQWEQGTGTRNVVR